MEIWVLYLIANVIIGSAVVQPTYNCSCSETDTCNSTSAYKTIATGSDNQIQFVFKAYAKCWASGRATEEGMERRQEREATEFAEEEGGDDSCSETEDGGTGEGKGTCIELSEDIAHV
jgi:hypothetical protein